MKVYCPYCKKEVKYKIEKRDIRDFKGIKINSYENVACCDNCKNDLYVNDLEKENNDRIYNEYRIIANILEPNNIINLRKRYNISQRELTSILGFGKMTINRYENGGLPSKSQSDYLKLLIDNQNEFIKKVKESYMKENITKKTFEKVMKSNETLTSEKNTNILLREYIISNLYKEPNIYNGYKKFDLEIVENMISYIASKVNNLTITSLNKYLWYIDMLSFKQRGISITGLTYQKQQYGPTITNWKYEEISKLDDKYLRKEYKDKNSEMSIQKIESKNNYDISLLEQNEINIINTIIKLLKNKKVIEISEMSHKEDGWKKTNLLQNISFEYAINLNQ